MNFVEISRNRSKIVHVLEDRGSLQTFKDGTESIPVINYGNWFRLKPYTTRDRT